MTGEFGLRSTTLAELTSRGRVKEESTMQEALGNLIFRHRKAVVVIFLLVTVFMVWQASHLKIDAGFAKLLPLEHPYMQTYLQYRDAYGGANKVVIAIKARGRRHLHPRVFQGAVRGHRRGLLHPRGRPNQGHVPLHPKRSVH